MSWPIWAAAPTARPSGPTASGLRLQQRRLPLAHRGRRLPAPGGQADDYSGGRIERVTSGHRQGSSVSTTAWTGAACAGPNDIVFDTHGGFYFTDLGKGREADMDMGAVHYGHADGRAAQVVARPLLTPNGVGLSPDGRTLYYAETAGARLWAYDITAPGVVRKHAWPSPNGGRMLAASPGGHLQRFDSLAVDVTGQYLRGHADARRHHGDRAGHRRLAPYPGAGRVLGDQHRLRRAGAAHRLHHPVPPPGAWSRPSGRIQGCC
jgi:sugar lactone lactonase YvrE